MNNHCRTHCTCHVMFRHAHTCSYSGTLGVPNGQQPSLLYVWQCVFWHETHLIIHPPTHLAQVRCLHEARPLSLGNGVRLGRSVGASLADQLSSKRCPTTSICLAAGMWTEGKKRDPSREECRHFCRPSPLEWGRASVPLDLGQGESE